MDFLQFKDQVKVRFNLDLNSYKENQLKRRLDSLMVKQKVNAGDYAGFYTLLSGNTKTYKEFLDTLTINVSEFFRDRAMFQFLEDKVLPELLMRKKNLKIWSAACSSGAEPYSFAIILDEISPKNSHRIEGSDIDRSILNAALQARYNPDQVRNVSSSRQTKFFRREGNGYVLNDPIKSRVSFRRHDLLLDPFQQGYDLIACRNVTIYFTREAQEKLNNKFYLALNPGGVLFIGASEMIFNYHQLGFEKLASCFYRRI